MDTNQLKKSLSILKLAEKADKEGDYKKSDFLYQQACECADCNFNDKEDVEAKKKKKKMTCWQGYHRVPGTKPGSPGSCVKD